MWRDVFGDSERVVDSFFQKTAEAKNILAAFYGNEPVSVLYLLDSTVRVGGCDYKAYYVYAVCTVAEHRGKGLMKALLDLAYERAVGDKVSYLFLVPAEESLFELYGKYGYKTGFFYKELQLNSGDFPEGDYKPVQLNFDDFIKYRRGVECALATPCEKTFNSFYSPAGDEIKVICIKGQGYCVAEHCDGRYIVHELFGNKSAVLRGAFDALGCKTLVLKGPAASGGQPYGMYRAVNDAPDFDNGFFGIPYGG